MGVVDGARAAVMTTMIFLRLRNHWQNFWIGERRRRASLPDSGGPEANSEATQVYTCE